MEEFKNNMSGTLAQKHYAKVHAFTNTSNSMAKSSRNALSVTRKTKRDEKNAFNRSEFCKCHNRIHHLCSTPNDPSMWNQIKSDMGKIPQCLRMLYYTLAVTFSSHESARDFVKRFNCIIDDADTYKIEDASESKYEGQLIVRGNPVLLEEQQFSDAMNDLITEFDSQKSTNAHSAVVWELMYAYAYAISPELQYSWKYAHEAFCNVRSTGFDLVAPGTTVLPKVLHKDAVSFFDAINSIFGKPCLNLEEALRYMSVECSDFLGLELVITKMYFNDEDIITYPKLHIVPRCIQLILSVKHLIMREELDVSHVERLMYGAVTIMTNTLNAFAEVESIKENGAILHDILCFGIERAAFVTETMLRVVKLYMESSCYQRFTELEVSSFFNKVLRGVNLSLSMALCFCETFWGSFNVPFVDMCHLAMHNAIKTGQFSYTEVLQMSMTLCKVEHSDMVACSMLQLLFHCNLQTCDYFVKYLLHDPSKVAKSLIGYHKSFCDASASFPMLKVLRVPLEYNGVNCTASVVLVVCYLYEELDNPLKLQLMHQAIEAFISRMSCRDKSLYLTSDTVAVIQASQIDEEIKRNVVNLLNCHIVG